MKRTRTNRVRIAVSDVSDEKPTGLTLSGATVAENRPAGTVLGTLATVDTDSSDTYTYKVLSGAGFRTVGSELQTDAPFDFELASTRTVRVQSTAANGDTIEKEFAVIDHRRQRCAERHQAHPGQDHRRPCGPGGRHLERDRPGRRGHATFALVAGAGDTDNASFMLGGAELRAAQALGSGRSTYSVRVQVTDAAGAAYVKALTVRVDPVNHVNRAPYDLTAQQRHRRRGREQRHSGGPRRGDRRRRRRADLHARDRPCHSSLLAGCWGGGRPFGPSP